MNPDALAAWGALYIAVGALALICAALAGALTAQELLTGTWRPASGSRAQVVLIVPRVWLRWQRNYLLGAPAILAIALAFACHLGFDVLWHIEPIG